MRSFLGMLCLFSLLFVPVSGHCGFFSGSKAKLSEPAMTDRVDPETQAPLAISSHFPPETAALYATIKVSDAPQETEIKAVFFMLGDAEQQIAENAVVTNGTGYIGFTLNPPPSGWPKSRYKVLFFLNGKQEQELFFTVEDTPGKIEKPAAAADGQNKPVSDQAPASPYKTFKDAQFGFSFELPPTWEFHVAPKGDYVFAGPAGTDESEITIIVQIIDPRKGQIADLKTQMIELVNQIEKVPQAVIVKKDQITVSGNEAPFFLATYPAQNSKKQTVEFGHTQLGIEHAPYLLLISYAAPRDIYQQKIDIFQHMIDTTQLFQPKP